MGCALYFYFSITNSPNYISSDILSILSLDVKSIKLKAYIDQNKVPPRCSIFRSAIRYQHVELLKSVVENGFSIQKSCRGARSFDDQTDQLTHWPAYMYLFEYGGTRFDIEIANTLKKLGADYRFINKNNQNILHFVLEFSPENYINFTREKDFLTVDVFKAILEFSKSIGVDINLEDSKGVTPLMLATQTFYNKEFVGLLINNGADLNRVNNVGQSALAYALTKRPSAGRDALIVAKADIVSDGKKISLQEIKAAEAAKKVALNWHQDSASINHFLAHHEQIGFDEKCMVALRAERSTSNSIYSPEAMRINIYNNKHYYAYTGCYQKYILHFKITDRKGTLVDQQINLNARDGVVKNKEGNARSIYLDFVLDGYIYWYKTEAPISEGVQLEDEVAFVKYELLSQ
jgi:hypothetical protein